jgi:hypothetical protein
VCCYFAVCLVEECRVFVFCREPRLYLPCGSYLPWAGPFGSRHSFLCRASTHGTGVAHGNARFSSSDSLHTKTKMSDGKGEVRASL